MKPFYLLLVIFSLFTSTVIAQQLAPTIQWSKCLGGTNDDKAFAMIPAHNGGYMLAGSSKSNDGDVTGHHGSVDSTDAWVVKISVDGNMEWQRSYGGDGVDEFRTIIRTKDGNYVCFGTTTSNNGDVTGNHGHSDWWVVKIDTYGNILWKKTLGGSYNETVGNIRENADGSFFAIGVSKSSDGDLAGYNPSASTAWIVKLGANGDILYQDSYGITEIGTDIIESDNGSYIISVRQPHGSEMKFTVVKLNATGTQVWVHYTSEGFGISIAPAGKDQYGTNYFVTVTTMPCTAADYHYMRTVLLRDNGTPNSGTSSTITEVGQCPPTDLYYTRGYVQEGPNTFSTINGTDHISVASFDPLDDVASPHGDYDGFVLGYRQNLQKWKAFIGGPGKDHLYAVNPVNETEFYVAGHTNSNSGQVSGNHGGHDVWIVKMGQVNLVKGTVFADYNSNSMKEANEPFVDNLLVQSQKIGHTVSSSTLNGQFINTVDTGNYTTKVLTTVPYHNIVPATKSTSFSTYNNSDSFSFAMQVIPGQREYGVSLAILSQARPGFETIYGVRYTNEGTDTLTNRIITLIKDSHLTFVEASLAPSSVSGDTLRWEIASLLPHQYGFITVNFTADAPPILNNGDTLYLSATIDTAGDLVPANNFTSLSQVVTGSYDPNDKQESHNGIVSPQEIAAGKPLLYTIRFQNTGTDTAFNIVVRDTLDANADWTSLQMAQASHPYTFVLKDGKYCTWTFSNILLPDSNVNEPMSHGYIVYRIKPKSNLVIGDEIKNSAAIYFDFNLPVITNTVVTAVKPEPPALPSITGLMDNYCSTAGIQKGKIINLPASGSGITVTAKIDGNAVAVAADSTFSFNVTTLSAGTHTISVEYNNITASRTAAEEFNINTAVDANVNVSANITNVTSLATPVIVTAVNAAGGGTAPLYTFAKDRGFTVIVQAESAQNTWTFDPTILAVGDNKIYVRMKSNASCVVSNTVLDSILIVRSSVTGITDPDMPGQVINIYPNPFKDVITINGLSSSKTYTVRLFNFEGKELISKRVSGRTSIALSRQHQAAGIYWLSIYDEKRKQMLGTVKMLK
jgi:uncharacterized repeat protein (TIGR01451 family)